MLIEVLDKAVLCLACYLQYTYNRARLNWSKSEALLLGSWIEGMPDLPGRVAMDEVVSKC